jgi:antirestriction protein ArdC
MEELVAEISAAFVCADLGIEHDPRDNTATYVGNWLKVLKQDSRAVITAAAKAQTVADYLRQFSSSKG